MVEQDVDPGKEGIKEKVREKLLLKISPLWHLVATIASMGDRDK